jgi:hypothetical protein
MYSSCVANFVLVWRKNGEICLCMDCLNLNFMSLKDNYPLPHMDQLRQRIKGVEMLSMLDVFSKYNLLMITTA